MDAGFWKGEGIRGSEGTIRRVEEGQISCWVLGGKAPKNGVLEQSPQKMNSFGYPIAEVASNLARSPDKWDGGSHGLPFPQYIATVPQKC